MIDSTWPIQWAPQHTPQLRCDRQTHPVTNSFFPLLRFPHPRKAGQRSSGRWLLAAGRTLLRLDSQILRQNTPNPAWQPGPISLQRAELKRKGKEVLGGTRVGCWTQSLGCPSTRSGPPVRTLELSRTYHTDLPMTIEELLLSHNYLLKSAKARVHVKSARTSREFQNQVLLGDLSKGTL